MGISNLRVGLERKFADWLGEERDITKHIEEVTAAFEALNEKRDRLAKVEQLLASTKVIMAEIAPTWNPASIKPSRKFAMKIPFKLGEATRMAFDVMREEDRPMRSREISELVVARKGLDPTDRDLVTRVKVAVDAALLGQHGQFVDYTGSKFAREWFIKPAASPASPNP